MGLTRRECTIQLAIIAALGLSSAGVIAAAPRPERPEIAQERRTLLGTWVTLKVVADRAAAREHLAAGFQRIAALERCLSAHDRDSELSRVMRTAARKRVQVSEDLFAALQAAATWNRRSQGAFDITVAPLLDLWRRCGRENRLPKPEEIAHARGRLGAAKILLDPGARTVRLQRPDLRLDLGGLGKGYCADAVAQVFRRRGVTGALIAIAGDISALGRRPDGEPWHIGIQDPRHPETPMALITVLALSDRAVSTSGNYQRFVEIGGRRYSHIVDPRTGRTAESVPSVTVVGPDTLTTDILGTVLSVLGTEAGMNLVESLPTIEAMFVTFPSPTRTHIMRSSGFAAYEITGTRHTDYRK